ncbi:c-type cytochrome [Belnapia sp. T18]|uniref:C-type cytochrome n=1 Tax=Belnapia arida TaxID=2804533 RepID=A0ABS1TWP4_9PROT|nr:cytochrome c peroxidase [Belnapia arida]MBL6076865.1 c-type cytochrome [Belnapia arida]
MRVALRLASVPLAALLLAAILMSRGLEREVPPRPAAAEATGRLHPIGVLRPMAVEERRRALGERIFADPRLSGDGSRACASCHDLRTNGATANRRDLGLDGQELPLNTATVFNAAFSFRFGWEGSTRSLEAHAETLLRSPAIMGASPDMVVKRLSADPFAVAAFYEAYRRPPDKEALLDALGAYQRSLVTPGSPFDRWLAGEAEAITPEEQAGYALFRSVGCTACHQGANVGGNLFQRHGIFHALATPEPQILRVPSLRNVAVTAPYFHDGSAATLEEAVRGMGLAQLNLVLDDGQIASIIAFLRTLTGSYRGTPLASPP